MEKTELVPTRMRHLRLLMYIPVLLFLGLIYAWSVFIAPLEAEFGWLRTDTSVTFTVSMCCFCLGSFLGTFVSSRFSVRAAAALAGVLLAAGFFGASRVSTLPAFIAFYGVGCGGGTGVAYNATVSLVSRWFTDRKGLVSGIAMMFFGSGGMVLSAVASGLMNDMGWRRAFIVLGIAIAVIIAAALWAYKYPPENMVFPAPARRASRAASVSVPAVRVWKSGSWWALYIWSIAICAPALMITSNAAPIAGELGADASMQVAFVSAVSVCNGLSRVITGELYDRWGRKIAVGYSCVALTLNCAFLFAGFLCTSLPMLFIGFCLTGLALGSAPPIFLVCSQEFFGEKYYSGILSFANTNTFFTSTFTVYAAGAIQTATGSYFNMLWIYIGMVALVWVSAAMLKKPTDEQIQKLIR